VALITEDEKATRLARAILADIQLYNHDAIAEASPQLNNAIAEGRGLFQSRVDPSLYALFENALADSSLAPWGRSGNANAPYRPPPMAPPAPQEPRANTAVIVLIALAALALGILVYFTAHQH
jgi:hypothetical protein